MTWIRPADLAAAASQTEGPVKAFGKHEAVPKELVKEAELLAKKEVDGEDEEEENKMEVEES